ncbi:hypothetical protein [Psychromonas antarctica]|uniref:hypothetical protein n=1 Tax=Psychromonas antarctica TaxID=67573 RepID=UPI001EE962BB|nr:hypothetical protein [Psychromonas antarctica]MCG6202025.1 hypothetical protein [Psychromonas antarctica]
MEIITKQQALDKGLKRFFTGEPCHRGHISERFIAMDKCVTCNSEIGKLYYQKNKEKISIQRKKYYKELKAKKQITS